MAAPKGHARYGGRQKGTPNKLTNAARAAFESAFEGIGGVERLKAWAQENTTDFYKLYARLIPHEIAADDETKDALASGLARAYCLPATSEDSSGSGQAS